MNQQCHVRHNDTTYRVIFLQASVLFENCSPRVNLIEECDDQLNPVKVVDFASQLWEEVANAAIG